MELQDLNKHTSVQVGPAREGGKERSKESLQGPSRRISSFGDREA